MPADAASSVREPTDCELLARNQRVLFARAADIHAHLEWRNVCVEFSGIDVWPLGLLGHAGSFTLGDLLELWSRELFVVHDGSDRRPHFLVRIAGSILSGRNQVTGFDEGSAEVRTGPLPQGITLGSVAVAVVRGWRSKEPSPASTLRLIEAIEQLQRSR